MEVADLATQNISKTKGEVFNMGGGSENTISLLELLEYLEELSGKKKEVPFIWEKLKSFGLTRREEEILRVMVEDGITENTILSERFSIKISTVKQHLSNIFGKFDVTNRSSLISAVIKAMRQPN